MILADASGAPFALALVQSAVVSHHPISRQPFGPWCLQSVSAVAAVLHVQAIYCTPCLAYPSRQTAARLPGDRKQLFNSEGVWHL